MLQVEACSICEGFYGESFGEPLCSTCHLFLFPENETVEVSFVEVRTISAQCTKYCAC